MRKPSGAAEFALGITVDVPIKIERRKHGAY